MSYDDFRYETVGASDGEIANWRYVELPIRAIDSPANLYVRLTGIAQAVRGDPEWTTGPVMHRGRIEITTDPIFDVDDVLIGSCGTVGFARIDLDDSSAGSADFSFALDAIGRVAITAKTCSIEVLAAYRGDTELKAIGFSADLLIYRPGLARP